MSPLVFDNTPLSHFARARALPALQGLAAGYRCVVPAEVVRELIAGIQAHPAISATINLPWLEVVELTDIDEVVAFARYKAELGGGVDHNNGESAVLAWAHIHGPTAIIDERNGHVIKTLANQSGADEVWFNEGDGHYFLAMEARQTTRHGEIVAEGAVSVDLRKIGKNALDEIHRVGPLRVPREYSLDPRWIRRFCA